MYKCGACSKDFKTDDDFILHTPVHAIGFCIKCKRWYSAASQVCPTCELPFEIYYEAHSELRNQLAQLVLALQEVVPLDKVKTVQLDPKQWGSDSSVIVKAACNPLFWSNMTSPDIRMAVGLLTSVAGQYGVNIATNVKLEEVSLTDAAGKVTVFLKNPQTGVLVQKR